MDFTDQEKGKKGALVKLDHFTFRKFDLELLNFQKI